MIKKIVHTPVSVIVPIRNVSSTLALSLQSLIDQTYPIAEIIVIDNVSKDNSIQIALEFRKKTPIPIILIRQKQDKSVSSSFNIGVKKAKSSLVVLYASDCILASIHELTKLVMPLQKSSDVVSSFPTVEMPLTVWKKYNFWQKYFSARMVGINHPEMVLKFDCVRRDIFLKLGGFDDVNFGGDGNIGGEDAEFNSRLRNKGLMVKSSARVFHIHSMAKNYSLWDMMNSRKKYSRSYGRFIMTVGLENPIPSLTFLIRPILCVMPFIPSVSWVGIGLLVLYSFLFTKIMYTSAETRTDYRILTIPILNIFFLYHDLFWMLEAAVTTKKRKTL